MLIFIRFIALFDGPVEVKIFQSQLFIKTTKRKVFLAKKIKMALQYFVNFLFHYSKKYRFDQVSFRSSVVQSIVVRSTIGSR